MRAVLWSCEYACDGNAWNLPEVACEASGEASACGGSVSRSGRSGRARRLRGHGEPAYCSDRSNLESSIKGLTSLNASSGISGLKTQLRRSRATPPSWSAQPRATSPAKPARSSLRSQRCRAPSKRSRRTQAQHSSAPSPPLRPAWSARSRASWTPPVPTAADQSRFQHAASGRLRRKSPPFPTQTSFGGLPQA